MRIQLKPLEEQTLVITGASSGIGLTTALQAAGHGANLVLVARGPEALGEAAEQCRAKGAEVETVVADVGDRATIGLVVDRAKERFGGFDTWVNNAGVSAYGELRDIPENDARGLFETNYWGVVHGSLAVADYVRQRDAAEHGVALINLGSVLSDRAIPLQGHYAASKHAVKGFTEALRMELEKEGLPISVTLVKPSATDTPYPEHAANYMGKEASLPEPTYAPEVVARAILGAAEDPIRDLTVGAKDGVMTILGNLFPGLTDKIMETSFFDQQKGDASFFGNRHGIVQEPGDGFVKRRGDAEGHVMESSLYTQAQRHPFVAAGLAVAAGVALAAMNRS
jgi:short-subunit dehydrogenase